MYRGISTKIWLIFILLSSIIYLVVYKWLAPQYVWIPMASILLFFIRFRTHISKIVVDRLIIDNTLSFILCSIVGKDYMIVCYLFHCMFTVIVNNMISKKNWINYLILFMMFFITVIGLFKSVDNVFKVVLSAMFMISMLVYFVIVQSLQCNYNLYIVLKNIHDKACSDKSSSNNEIERILVPLFCNEDQCVVDKIRNEYKIFDIKNSGVKRIIVKKSEKSIIIIDSIRDIKVELKGSDE